MKQPFWEKPIDSLSTDEWERLCDGCAQCCLVKLQDDETDEIFATDVVCRYLDCGSGCCTVYPQRADKKPECFVIERGNVEHYSWLPKTCAYRLRFECRPLPDWHPLITGSRDAMVEAEIAVTNWCTNEDQLGDQDLRDHVLFSLREEV
jgi:uncharacterized cysteine cluster protein YcgN (CxxCxxCC family)